MYRSPPRPLPYDADPRYVRLQRDGLVSRREKGSSHSQEETEPLRSDTNVDSVPLNTGDKWNQSTCEEGSKEYQTKSSFKLSATKATTGFAPIYSSSDDEDVCPTCLEGEISRCVLFIFSVSLVVRLTVNILLLLYYRPNVCVAICSMLDLIGSYIACVSWKSISISQAYISSM